ncbi:MAG: rhomboid family intramembrane serine protease [Clostridium sp.]|nr:rhomboid family intramembrane serine protease [Clostridium sp.]
MEKFEKLFFNILTKEMNFFIRDYYSIYNNQNKWVALLDINHIYVAVLVVNDWEEENIYNEAKEYLSNNLNKSFIINLVVLTKDNYITKENTQYNKLVYSLKDKEVIYCSEGSKAFLPVIEFMKDTNTKKREVLTKGKFTNIFILINIFIFIIEVFISKNLLNIDVNTLVYMGAKLNIAINHGEIYRLITAAFLHGGILHILFNMSALNIIGKEVEKVYGGKKFLIIYLFSAIGGNLFSYLFSPSSISVGASGAIFGLLGAMLLFGIKGRVGKKYLANMIETIVINIIISFAIPNIDIFGHIGGLIIGFLVSGFLLKKRAV